MSGLTLPWALQQIYYKGKPLSNGLIYFYVGGTTNTPKPIYNDYAMSSYASNPLQLDADGFVPQYYAESGLYKIVICTSAGVEIQSRDYINVVEGIDNSTGVYKSLVSGSDSTPGYLGDKIIAGSGISVSTATSATVQQLSIASLGMCKTIANDTNGYLFAKFADSDSITFSLNSSNIITASVNMDGIINAYKVKVNGADTAGYLNAKLVSSPTANIIESAGTLSVQVIADSVGDHKVVVNASDSTPSYLSSKITGAGGISISASSDNSQLIITSAQDTNQILASSTDTIASYLGNKIKAGTNVAITTATDSTYGEQLWISARSNMLVNVTNVALSEYTIVDTDVCVNSNYAGAATITLPTPNATQVGRGLNIVNTGTASLTVAGLPLSISGTVPTYSSISCRCVKDYTGAYVWILI